MYDKDYSLSLTTRTLQHAEHQEAHAQKKRKSLNAAEADTDLQSSRGGSQHGAKRLKVGGTCASAWMAHSNNISESSKQSNQNGIVEARNAEQNVRKIFCVYICICFLLKFLKQKAPFQWYFYHCKNLAANL
jgi:hypothetical protein